MKIALDFDGVLANTNLLKKQFAENNFGFSVPVYYCDKSSFTRLFGERNYRIMVSELYTKKMTLITPPTPGALQTIKLLSKDHELILISDRPASRLDWAKEWLLYKNILNFFRYIISSNKTQKYILCQSYKCNMLIDDDVRHLKIGNFGFSRVLFKYGAEQKIFDDLKLDNIYCASSWKMALKIIEDLEK